MSRSPDDLPIISGEPLVPRLSGNHLSVVLDGVALAKPGIIQAFWSGGEIDSISLAELRRHTLQMASGLNALGIKKGDVVAIQMPNRRETAIAYRACFSIGACLLPITHIYGASELSFILRNSRAKVLITPDRWRSIDFIERIGLIGNCPTLEHFIIVGETPLSGALSWERLMHGKYEPFQAIDLSPDDPVLLLYTSGTTSNPKGVLHSSRSLLAEVDQRMMAGERPEETSFSAWPAGHIGGFGSLMTPQFVGGPAIIMDRWVPEVGARLIADHRVARTAGVPVLLLELLDASRTQGADLSGLRSYMTGAANVPPEIVERASAAGIAVFRCYGSSEHPTVTASAPDDPLWDRAFTDGAVLPGGEVRLIDDEGCDVAGWGEGEILTRGPELFLGYLDGDRNDTAFLDGGWFKTGDIGRFENGKLIITDRKKDIIIRGGENISSKEVEDVLSRYPGVIEVAAFAVPHERLGEGICVAVRIAPGVTLALDDIIHHFAATGVARQKTPERLEIVEEMPRTASGKVKKYELRSRFG